MRGNPSRLDALMSINISKHGKALTIDSTFPPEFVEEKKEKPSSRGGDGIQLLAEIFEVDYFRNALSAR